MKLTQVKTEYPKFYRLLEGVARDREANLNSDYWFSNERLSQLVLAEPILSTFNEEQLSEIAYGEHGEAEEFCKQNNIHYIHTMLDELYDENENDNDQWLFTWP